MDGLPRRASLALAALVATAVAVVLAAFVLDDAGPAAPSQAVAQAGADQPSVTTECSAVRARPPATATSGTLRISGGCAFGARGKFRFHMLSAVQDLHFADCSVEFVLRVDGSGSVRIDDFSISGESPCNDAKACFKDFEPPQPWRGRIVADRAGGFLLPLDVCFDTCMGRFRGRLETRLVPESARRWRLDLDPAHGRVGTTGWRLEGKGWTMTSKRPAELEDRSDAPAG